MYVTYSVDTWYNHNPRGHPTASLDLCVFTKTKLKLKIKHLLITIKRLGLSILYNAENVPPRLNRDAGTSMSHVRHQCIQHVYIHSRPLGEMHPQLCMHMARIAEDFLWSSHARLIDCSLNAKHKMSRYMQIESSVWVFTSGSLYKTII